MSAVLILPLVYSYSCNNLSTYEPSFTLTLAKFSLGNIYRADRTGYLIITCADIVSMLVFFVFYLHWRHFHADTVAMMEIDQVFLNPTSYAVTVNGVAEVGPEMTCELLKEYI